VRVADGFTLHAATRAGALDTAGREALLRYVLRPPIAQERVTRGPQGLVRITLKKPWADGTVAVDMAPLVVALPAGRLGARAALQHGPLRRRGSPPMPSFARVSCPRREDATHGATVPAASADGDAPRTIAVSLSPVGRASGRHDRFDQLLPGLPTREANFETRRWDIGGDALSKGVRPTGKVHP
jgi:hypothetical protein